MKLFLRRLWLLLLCAACALLLTGCYQEIDPWPEAPYATATPAVTPIPTQVPQAPSAPAATEAPTLEQPGLNG